MTNEPPKITREQYLANLADTPIVHIFAQPFEHTEAFIVCNEAGLEKLTELVKLDRTGSDHVALSVSDGEGYNLHLCLVDDEGMDIIATPYTWGCAEERSEARNEATLNLFRDCVERAEEEQP